MSFFMLGKCLWESQRTYSGSLESWGTKPAAVARGCCLTWWLTRGSNQHDWVLHHPSSTSRIHLAQFTLPLVTGTRWRWMCLRNNDKTVAAKEQQQSGPCHFVSENQLQFHQRTHMTGCEQLKGSNFEKWEVLVCVVINSLKYKNYRN